MDLDACLARAAAELLVSRQQDSIRLGLRMGDGQEHDETRPEAIVARRDQTGRAILALRYSRDRFAGPDVVIADDETRPGVR